MERGPAPPGGGLPGHDRPGRRLEPGLVRTAAGARPLASPSPPAPTPTSRPAGRSVQAVCQRPRPRTERRAGADELRPPAGRRRLRLPGPARQRAPRSSPATPGSWTGAGTPSSPPGACWPAAWPPRCGRSCSPSRRFEDHGTLPNALNGDSTADRDTSDAPLWFALAVEEAAAADPGLYRARTRAGAPWPQVLGSIASGYLGGTANGIRVDPASGLVWSPSHFTWMDTNYPAATPREGYPVEIQALWIRLLRQLERLEPAAPGAPGADLARPPWSCSGTSAWTASRTSWPGPRAAPPAAARPDGLLRPNQVFLVSLGLVEGDRARRAVTAVRRYLLVPGALRSLAPLPAPVPLAVRGPGGALLNDPHATPTGAATKGTRTPGASRPTTTAPPGSGCCRRSARPWPGPGTSSPRRWPRPGPTWAPWTACWRPAAWASCPRSWTATRPTPSAVATRRRGASPRRCGCG